MQINRLPTIAALCAALTGSVVLTTATGCASTPTRESMGESVDNSLITSKIKTAFVNDTTVSALAISVETFKGTVQLSGFVNTQTEKERAATLAGEVEGVKIVKNDIHVKTQG